MNSVAIYVRLSDEDMDKQGNVDSRSIANQKDMLTAYCNEREWDIYDIYCDDGITGMERERPEFQRMLKDCEERKVNIVLCKDQSRFARDKVLIAEYLQTKFMVWGIRFIGVTDNVDSTSGYYLEQTDMNAMLNEWFVRNTSIKVKAVFDDKRRQGKFIGSYAPYGYIKDPADKNHLIPDENVRNIVTKIFEEYNKGRGVRSIAVMLNEKGIPCPTVYKKQNGSTFHSHSKHEQWSVNTVRNILTDEIYTGTVVQGRTKKPSYRSKERISMSSDEWIRVPNMHEPLISQEMWEKAQARRYKPTRASRQTNELCPLSRKVICGECGDIMGRRVSYNNKTGKMYYSMYCRCHRKGMTCCTNFHSVSGKRLEQECLHLINDAIHSYYNSDESKISQIQETNLKHLTTKLQKITAQRDKVQKRIDSLYMDKLDGIISQEEYLQYKEQFSSEITKNNEQLADVEKDIAQIRKHMQDISYRQELIEKYSNLTELTFGVADDFIESITVGNVSADGSRKIDINLKI